MLGIFDKKQKNIEEQYGDAVDFLNDNYAYFLTNVLNIGHPIWSDEMPTAAVRAKTKMARKDEFEFVFNPTFASNLTTEEFAFVLAHETMHIVLYHLGLAKKFDNPQVANISMDAVVNDYLNNAGFKLVKGVVRGEDVVGFDCSNTTVTDVYDLLKNNPDYNGSGDKCDGKCSGSQSGQGQGGQCTCPGKAGQFTSIDDHNWMHDPELAEKIEQAIKDAIKAGQLDPNDLPADLAEIKNETMNTYASGMMAGTQDGTETQFIKDHNVSLKWTELLKRLDPDLFRQPGMGPKPLSSFRRPRRKLTSMYPKVILPIYETPLKGEINKKKTDVKPSIVLALDVSGSIGNATARKFVSLAQTIPRDKINLFACTFDTNFRELNIDSPHYNHGGGTNFSAIEEFIRKCVIPRNENKYPKAVVVVTDGQAGFNYYAQPTMEQAKGWFWILLNQQQANSKRSTFSSQYGFDPQNFDVLNNFI